jgi:ABC-type antimicrobial peptide transport system permease subunit
MNMPFGYREGAEAEQVFAQYHPVDGDYFGVLGIELLEGRLFDASDREGSAPVVVVNDRLAAEHFGGVSAVGRTIMVLTETKTVVGVVRGTRHYGPAEDPPAEIYVPMGHDPWPHAQILVRGDDATAATALATVLDEVDPGLGVPPPTPYVQYVQGWFAAIRLQVIIVGLMGVVGTLLATLGIYALVSYRVSARRREIGVRLALGASDRRMFSDVVVQGVRLAAGGIVLGVATWYAVVPVLGEFLGDAGGRSPWAPLVVALGVGVVAALASAVPAARSVTVDPATTLRAE